ncbi:MAG: DUF3137 domain-containing protein [Cyclobacteriaceae bacterium]
MDSDIKELYELLLPRLEALEEQRLVVLKKLESIKKTSLIVGGIILVLLFFVMGLFWGSVVSATISITVYTLLYHRAVNDFKRNYKQNIFQELIQALGPQYSYDMDGNLEEDIMKESGLFHQFNSVKCEDLIQGDFDRYAFQMGEINLWYNWANNKNDVDRGGATSYIFKGLFFVGTTPVHFPLKIWILSKFTPQVHPVSRINDDWEKVEVKHLAFRKEYQVYSDNKAMATKLLQPKILETILSAREKVVEDKMRYEISFQGNQVYVSIATTKELFEPQISTPMTDFDVFAANFKFLTNTTSLLKNLNISENLA